VMNFANRRQWDLYSALKKIHEIPELADLSDKFIKIKNRILRDVERFIELSRTHATGRVLYVFLTETGYLEALVKNQTAENEEKIKNIAKFFESVKNFEYVAKEDRVLHFVNYLDALVSAGDDPPVAEADLDVPAVNILTIHKAKGLEFPVVFLISLVEGKFPWPARHEPLELPEELIKDILPVGDFHIQEERRLFYVGMTRAEKELILTSAADYGTQRQRKISRFVTEAVSTKAEAKAVKVSALQAIERHAPRLKSVESAKEKTGDDKILTLSYFQIDDYLTCPLKYKYVHIFRIPIMAHHTVLFGKALHDSIQYYHQKKMKGFPVTEDELLRVFEESFRREGFLSREHIELRLKEGYGALRNFYREEERRGVMPAYVERDFSFTLGNNRILGRWDRIDIQDGKATIIDFKSSNVEKQDEADKRAKESMQLSLYSLAYEKAFGKLPDFKELHFLESQLVGRAAVTPESVEKVIKKTEETSMGIRAGHFAAKPNRISCMYCAFNQICPSAEVRQR